MNRDRLSTRPGAGTVRLDCSPLFAGLLHSGIRHWLKRWRLATLGALFIAVGSMAQSPHGPSMKMDCAQCHSPENWTSIPQVIPFNHDSSAFPLTGTHQRTECRSCHPTLVFSEAPTECSSCHNDVHSMSLGNDCARCHTSTNWMVDAIPELHEQNGFALIGAHGALSCVDCHKAEDPLRFDRIGNDCISCHLNDFNATTDPNHVTAGFPTDCAMCHDESSWNNATFDHNTTGFPLMGAHTNVNCLECHSQRVRRNADQLRRLPPHRLQRDHRSEPRHRPVLHRLRHLSQRDGVAAFHLRSQLDGLPAHRLAHERRLLAVPRERVCRNAHELRCVPHDGLQRHH